MNIRPAEPGDASAIVMLWNGVIRDTLVTFTTEEKSTADIADMIDRRTGAFWVVENDGIQGFATYGPFRNGPGYAATAEHTIILDPGVQGRGWGRALMDMLEAGARAEGKRVLVAGISSANPDAVAFHERLGFVRTGYMPEVGRKAGQWLDLIFMQKSLCRT